MITLSLHVQFPISLTLFKVRRFRFRLLSLVRHRLLPPRVVQFRPTSGLPSMELRYRRLLLVLRVSRQLRRRPPGLDPVRHPARRRRRRRLSEMGPVPVHRRQAPPCRHRRLHLRLLPVHLSSLCVSSRQCVYIRGKLLGSSSVIIFAVSLKSTHGRHLKNRYNT